MNTSAFVEDSFSIKPNDLLASTLVKEGISYWYDDPEDWSIWSISVNGNEPQTIHLEWADITYGERPYFVCECGHKAAKLYLPLGGNQFKCRKCHDLKYQLATFNRYSVAGKELYKANRMLKLANNRVDMGRILYKGNYTKRFERWLGLCERAGYNDAVKGANDLIALIKR